MSDQQPFASWAVLELMGHRRLAGFVREVELAGSGMWRIDVPGADGTPAATQFYAPAAVYGLTPVGEDVARALADQLVPTPVTPLELALPAARRSHSFVGDEADCGLCGEGRMHYRHRQADDDDDDREACSCPSEYCELHPL